MTAPAMRTRSSGFGGGGDGAVRTRGAAVLYSRRSGLLRQPATLKLFSPNRMMTDCDY